jgi:DNA-binding LytR/AlgR family response regulator
MIKLKISKLDTKEKIDFVIQSEENASYVICDDISLFEKDKVNILINKENIPEIKKLVNALKKDDSRIIVFNTDKGLLRIFIQDIYYFQTYGTDLFLYTRGNNYLIKSTLYQLENLLKNDNFVRIGKATIVNVAKISEIRTAFNAKLLLVLDNKQQLEVMRSYVKSFKNFLKL